jgi:hypothetical protein
MLRALLLIDPIDNVDTAIKQPADFTSVVDLHLIGSIAATRRPSHCSAFTGLLTAMK